jgi:hypothetical protein
MLRGRVRTCEARLRAGRLVVTALGLDEHVIRRTLRVSAAKGRASQMARSRSTSTLKTMRAISAVLFLAVAGFVAAGVDEMRHWNILTGWELIAWALIPLALLLSFTLPVPCKVVRTNGLACGRWAYGLLFGCPAVAGHRWKKFRTRLQLPQREVKPVGRPQPASSLALAYQPARQQQRVKVTVEDGWLGIWGFWVSVASMIAAVIGVITAIVH